MSSRYTPNPEPPTGTTQYIPPRFAWLEPEHPQPIEHDEVLDWTVFDRLSVTNPRFAQILTDSMSSLPESIRTDRILPSPSRVVRTRTESTEPYRYQHFDYIPPSALPIGQVRSPHYLAHVELPFHATKRKAAELEQDIAEYNRMRMQAHHDEREHEQSRIRNAMAVERLSSPEPSSSSGTRTFSSITLCEHVETEPDTHTSGAEQDVLQTSVPVTHGDVVPNVPAPTALETGESEVLSSPSATELGDAAEN